MLSDLERDVVYLLEAVPGFEGAWRLPAKNHHERRFAIAVGVRDCEPWRVHLEMLGCLHPHEHASLYVFDPSVGMPPTVNRGAQLDLDDDDRRRAKASIDAREAHPFVPEGANAVVCPARRTILVVERETLVSTQLRERIERDIAIERVSTAFEGAPRWWWSNRIDPPDAVVVDLAAPDALKLAPSLTVQPRYVDRVFFIGDAKMRFPFVRHVARPLADNDIDAIVAAANGDRVVETLGTEPDHPVVVVVDPKRGFGRVVRAALEDAHVVVVEDGWRALDEVTSRRVEWIIFVFARAGDASRFLQFYKLFVRTREGLRDRVLFATDAAVDATVAVKEKFISTRIAADELRARLARR